MPPERRSLSDWYAESLRFTSFHLGDPADIPVADWWKGVTGSQPEEVLQTPQQQRAVAAGRFHEGVLFLESQPLRIDLTLQPLNEPPKTIAVPNIGILETAFTEFVEMSNALIHQGSFPRIRRMAVGAVLLLPVGGRKEGYEQLQPYLSSVTIDPVNSSDFVYRVNRKRASQLGISGLSINRLGQWNTVVTKLLGPLTVPPDATLPENHFCRIELDINTAPEYPDVLPEERLGDILSELVAAAKEIILQGDVK